MRSLLTLATAVVLMLMFRALAFTVYTVEGDGIEPLLVNGDRVIVNRWSYGLRTGGGGMFRYERWMRQKPQRGELVAFNMPMDTLHRISRRPVCAAYFEAGPGDTVWIGGRAMTVPGRCRAVKVEPWNMTLLCNTYRMHEGRKADIKDGKLYVDGKETTCASFAQDYCWVSNHGDTCVTDSRYFGFMPDSHIIGRIVTSAYSIDKTRHPASSLRKGRCMKILPRRHIVVHKASKDIKN